MFNLFKISTLESYLLQVALAEGQQQQDAWSHWQQHVDFDNLEAGYLLVPSAFGALESSQITTGAHLSKMKGIYRKNWAKNQLIIAQVQSAVARLQEAGITPTILDDLSYAIAYYDRTGLRPIYEVTLHIGQQHTSLVSDVFREMGWFRNRPQYWRMMADVFVQVENDDLPDEHICPSSMLNVPVASPTFQFCRTLTATRPHFILRLLDLGLLLRDFQHDLDWTYITQYAITRRVNLPLIHILRYLDETMHITALSHVIDTLSQNITWTQRAEHYFNRTAQHHIVTRGIDSYLHHVRTQNNNGPWLNQIKNRVLNAQTTQSYSDAFTPENVVLLAIVRREYTNRVDTQDVDWHQLYQAVQYHRLVPQFQQWLKNSPDQSCPESIRAQVKQHNDFLNKRNRLVALKLAQIIRALEAQGIRALAYKGPTLSNMLYGTVTARTSRDLDLLCHPDDIAQAVGMIKELGFTDILEEDIHVTCTNHTLNLSVEFHPGNTRRDWPITYHFDELWESAIDVQVGSLSIKVPSLDRLIPMLAVHGCRHEWEELVWVMDMAWLMQQDGIDWQKVYNHAQAQQCQNAVLFSVRLVHELFSVPIPEVYQTMTLPNLDTLLGYITQHCLGHDPSKKLYPWVFEFHLAVRDTQAQRRAFLRHYYVMKNIPLHTALYFYRRYIKGYRVARHIRRVLKPLF